MGFFRKWVLGRIETENNVLLLICGPTGSGKSWAGLRICEMFDPTFDARRICFRAKQFLHILPHVPNFGFILWDEPGIAVGHRTWLSQANLLIQFTCQSFRYKFVNVVFALPSPYYLDKVARELCHAMLTMERRGLANVYSIKKSLFADRMYTRSMGQIWLEPPNTHLVDAYEEMRAKTQDEAYEKFGQILERVEDKEREKMMPKPTLEDLVGRARPLLSEIVNPNAKTTRGYINVTRLARKLGISQFKAYQVRAQLIDELKG